MSVRSIFEISRAVQREALRNPAFLGLLVLGCVSMLISSVYGAVTIGDRFLVIESIGFSCASLSSILFIVWFGLARVSAAKAGTTALASDAVALSRVDSVLGTFLGVAYSAWILSTLLCVFLFCYLRVLGAEWRPEILEGALYMILESAITTGGLLFFSAILVTPLVIGVAVWAQFLLGRSASYVLLLNDSERGAGFSGALLDAVYWILPHFDSLAIYDQLVFGRSPGAGYFAWSCLYALSYLGLELMLAALCGERRKII